MIVLKFKQKYCQTNKYQQTGIFTKVFQSMLRVFTEHPEYTSMILMLCGILQIFKALKNPNY